MSVYKCSFRIYIIFYHRRPFNKTTATLVRPHPFSTLCTTPVGKMMLCVQEVEGNLEHQEGNHADGCCDHQLVGILVRAILLGLGAESCRQVVVPHLYFDI